MTANSATTQPLHSSLSVASLFIWLIIAPLCLWIVAEGFRAAPCAIAFPLAFLLSYPLWVERRESRLFSRRLLLAGATREDSMIRRRFWRGQLMAMIQVFPAALIALLLLAMAVRLNAREWAILFVDGAVLTVFYVFVWKKFASQVRPEMLGVVARGWPVRALNIGALVVAFAALQFFIQGAPDLRALDMDTVVANAMEQGHASVACPWTGSLVGAVNAVEDLSWMFAQRVIPGLPTPGWRLMGWVLFLLQVTLLSLFFTRLLIGVIAQVESRREQAESFIGDSALTKTFIGTIVVLALLSSYAATQLRDIDPSQFSLPVETIAQWIDPCHTQDEASAETQAALTAQLQANQVQIDQAMAARIDREVNLLFAPVEAAVDDYLDWYFTLAGEYQRLATLVAGDFVQSMAKELETRLFEESGFHGRLGSIEQALQTDTLNQLTGIAGELRDTLNERIQQNPCIGMHFDTSAWADVERDLWRSGAAGTTGAAAGVATTLLSKKVVTAVVAKIGAKKSIQAAGVMLGKFAAKKGAGTLAAVAGSAAGGTAICAPAGLAAVACGIAAGTATWLAVDKAAIEIDEALSRDTMRADMLAAIDEEKTALKVALRERQQLLMASLGQQLQTTIDNQFIPARDGL